MSAPIGDMMWERAVARTVFIWYLFEKRNGKWQILAVCFNANPQKLGLRIKMYDLVIIRSNFTFSTFQMKLF